MMFRNPPSHSQTNPMFIDAQSSIIIAYFCKMGAWELCPELICARVFKRLKFLARMINGLILPYSQFKEKELRLWELGYLVWLSRVWEWLGGSND